MLAGIVYSTIDKQLLEELNAVKEVIHRYNALSPADNAGRLDILKGLLGHIGDNVTIGAGSVVTKDIPSDVVAVGNPCRVIRRIK